MGTAVARTTEPCPEPKAVQLLRGVYYEEVSVGDRFVGIPVTITESMIVQACGLYRDLAPLHLDHERASAAGFRGTIAPGTLTLGVSIGPVSLIAGRAVATHLSDQITYRKPVYAGDTLDVTYEVTRMERKTRFGLVEYTVTVTNQLSETVAQIVTVMGHKYREREPVETNATT